jgi:hypothetical protein
MKALRRTLLGAILTFFLTAHTSVGSAASFSIRDIQPTEDGGFTLTWPTVPGRANQVMYTDSLDAPWEDLLGALLVADSNQFTFSYTDHPPANTAQRFYRIKTTYRIVLSLVLDRSGSMIANGGAAALPGAASNFIDLFIKSTVNTLVFSGWTCSERGLTNAFAQNASVTPVPGENLIKVIVFFTDGMANTWYYTFNCGPRNIAPDRYLYNPITGNPDQSGCTVPATIPSINGGPDVDTFSCVSMNTEAQKRAEAVANFARSQGNFIFTIGMGDPNSPGECAGTFPALNPEFLKNLANTPDSATYNPSQPSGGYVIAANAGELDQAFQSIVQRILSQSP